LVCGMGGLDGRALLAGDVLAIEADSGPRPHRRADGLKLPPAGRARLRVVPGPQADWFTEAAHRALTSTRFTVSPRSNRMGFFLDGPPLAYARHEEPISEPVTFGSIQVPRAGQPILLMADRPTAGGYPKIATVITADLPLAGQLAPGDAVEFEVCTLREAGAAMMTRERELMRQSGNSELT
jgi:allophanate hydrolase subunit 2